MTAATQRFMSYAEGAGKKDNIISFTPALYMYTLEDAFNKVLEYYHKGYDYNRINQDIRNYYEARNSDIAP